MSRAGPVLSELMVKYPFVQQSRQFFEELPVEEIFSSEEVIRQAEMRLLGCLGRVRYEPHISEIIDFSSFFAVAFVASSDSFLTQRFAAKEGERAKSFFVKESPQDKPRLYDLCFGLKMRRSGTDEAGYELRVEDYLQFASGLDILESAKWQLVNQSLADGIVRFSENASNDFFGEAAERMIEERVRNLRRAQFPRQLTGLRDGVQRFVPPQRPKSTKGFLYVEDLIKNPVTDGRHRFVWLVLSGYLTNIKELSDEQAVEIIGEFVAKSGDKREMKRFIEYNVRRARRLGLKPPTLAKLRTEHPDLYALLPKSVTEKPSAKAA